MDTAALAMDYRTMGFRECAAEVARYTVTMEGMDLHDPLRLRLLGHLQCYCSQRESAAKAASLHSHHAASSTPASAPWSGMQAPPQYPPVIGADQCLGLGSSQHSTAAPTYTDLGRMATQHATDGLGSTAASAAAGCSVASRTPATHPSYVTSSGGGMGPGSRSSHFMLQGLPQMYNHHQFPMPLSAMNSVLSTPSGVQPGSFAAQHALGKPYRPWGLELAY
jgi:YRPW motif-containing protein